MPSTAGVPSSCFVWPLNCGSLKRHLHCGHQPLLDIVFGGVVLAVLVLSGQAGELAVVLEQDAVDHPGERPVEPSQVGAARGGGNSVDERSDVGVVAGHPSHGYVDPAFPLDLGDLALDRHLLGEGLDPVQGDHAGNRIARRSVLDEIRESAPTHEIERLAVGVGAAVLQRHPQAGHKEAGLAEPPSNLVGIDPGVGMEELRVGKELHPCACGLGALPGSAQLASLYEASALEEAGLLVLEAQLIQDPVALYLHIDLGGEGVDHGCTHAVEPA